MFPYSHGQIVCHYFDWVSFVSRNIDKYIPSLFEGLKISFTWGRDLPYQLLQQFHFTVMETFGKASSYRHKMSYKNMKHLPSCDENLLVSLPLAVSLAGATDTN